MATAMTVVRQPPKLEDYITWQRKIVFNEATSNLIQVSFDRRPGFVVADGGQSKVRSYSEDGQLLWTAGRSGPGPEEFQRLRAAVRTSRGDVIALDNAGKLTFYDSLGNFQRTAPTQLSPTYSAVLVNDSTILISGRLAGDTRTRLLHVFDLRSDSLVTSFFEIPPHPPVLDEAFTFSGWASAALLGTDTIAVTFALTNTLYLYRLDGTLISALPLPLDHFRPLTEPGPRNDSPEAEIEWRNSYTRLTDLFHAPDGSLYVQFANMRKREAVWGLARFKFVNGKLERQFEVPEGILMLGISPRDASLHFLDTENMESTTWAVGLLSR